MYKFINIVICVKWEVAMSSLQESVFFFFFQAEDGIRDLTVTGVQTCALPISVQTPPYQNEALPFDVRVHDLVSRMTLEEKVSQVKDVAPAIDRLGIPPYNW